MLLARSPPSAQLDLPDPSRLRADLVELQFAGELGFVGGVDDGEGRVVAAAGPRDRAWVDGQHPVMLPEKSPVGVAEEDEGGGRSLRRADDPPKAVVDPLDVAVEEEDGPVGPADQPPEPEIGVAVPVAADALDPGKGHSPGPGGAFKVIDPVAHMDDEVDAGREALEGGAEIGDIVV